MKLDWFFFSALRISQSAFCALHVLTRSLLWLVQLRGSVYWGPEAKCSDFNVKFYVLLARSWVCSMLAVSTCARVLATSASPCCYLPWFWLPRLLLKSRYASWPLFRPWDTLISYTPNIITLLLHCGVKGWVRKVFQNPWKLHLCRDLWPCTGTFRGDFKHFISWAKAGSLEMGGVEMPLPETGQRGFLLERRCSSWTVLQRVSHWCFLLLHLLSQ